MASARSSDAIAGQYFRNAHESTSTAIARSARSESEADAVRLDIRYRTTFDYDDLVRESQNELRACPMSDASSCSSRIG